LISKLITKLFIIFFLGDVVFFVICGEIDGYDGFGGFGIPSSFTVFLVLVFDMGALLLLRF
jgi:hypothetical protein